MIYCFIASEHDEISRDYSDLEPDEQCLIKLNLVKDGGESGDELFSLQIKCKSFSLILVMRGIIITQTSIQDTMSALFSTQNHCSFVKT